MRKEAAKRKQGGPVCFGAGKPSRNRRKPNYKLLSVIFLASVFMFGSGSYALRTPDLQVKEISITGVELADKECVRKCAQCALGKNILAFRESSIIRSICALSEVESVDVTRQLPSGLKIEVTERKPDALLVTGNSCYMVQLDGYVIHKMTGNIAGIPKIETDDTARINAGMHVRSTNTVMALETLKLARQEKLQVGKISVDRGGDICLNMSSGFYVKLGQPDDIARKMSLLRNALVCKPSLAAEALYIDLSCPSAPVWMPKRHARAAS